MTHLKVTTEMALR